MDERELGLKKCCFGFIDGLTRRPARRGISKAFDNVSGHGGAIAPRHGLRHRAEVVGVLQSRGLACAPSGTRVGEGRPGEERRGRANGSAKKRGLKRWFSHGSQTVGRTDGHADAQHNGSYLGGFFYLQALSGGG